MSRVHDVDPALIKRAAEWLLSQQKADGSWKNDRGLVHENHLAAAWATTACRSPPTSSGAWIEAGFGKDAGTQKGLDYMRENQAQAKDRLRRWRWWPMPWWPPTSKPRQAQPPRWKQHRGRPRPPGRDGRSATAIRCSGRARSPASWAPTARRARSRRPPWRPGLPARRRASRPGQRRPGLPAPPEGQLRHLAHHPGHRLDPESADQSVRGRGGKGQCQRHRHPQRRAGQHRAGHPG